MTAPAHQHIARNTVPSTIMALRPVLPTLSAAACSAAGDGSTTQNRMHSNAPKHPIMALFIEICPFTKAVPLRWSKNRADRRENSLAMPPRSVLAAPIYWHQVITHTTIRHPPQSQRRSHNWTHQMQGRSHSRSHPPRCPAAAWESCAQCCCIPFRFQIPSC